MRYINLRLLTYLLTYEVTYNCYSQEQMKALHQATVYESTFRPNDIMLHHVVPNAKAMVSVTWKIPDKMYKIINV